MRSGLGEEMVLGFSLGLRATMAGKAQLQNTAFALSEPEALRRSLDP